MSISDVEAQLEAAMPVDETVVMFLYLGHEEAQAHLQAAIQNARHARVQSERAAFA